MSGFKEKQKKQKTMDFWEKSIIEQGVIRWFICWWKAF